MTVQMLKYSFLIYEQASNCSVHKHVLFFFYILERNIYEEGDKITFIGSTFFGQACKRIPKYQLSEVLWEVTTMCVWQTLGHLTAQLWKQKRHPHAWDEWAPQGNSRLSGESAVLWRRFTPSEETFQWLDDKCVFLSHHPTCSC